MRTLLRALTVAAVALPLAALPSTASAEAPQVLTGTFQITSFTPLSEEVIGGGHVVVSEFRNTSLSFGDIASTEPAEEQGRCVITPGSFRCQGWQTAVQVVTGLPGETTFLNRTTFSCDLTTQLCDGMSVTVSAEGAHPDLRARTVWQSSLTTGAGSFTSYVTGL